MTNEIHGKTLKSLENENEQSQISSEDEEENEQRENDEKENNEELEEQQQEENNEENGKKSKTNVLPPIHLMQIKPDCSAKERYPPFLNCPFPKASYTSTIYQSCSEPLAQARTLRRRLRGL